MPTGQFYTSHMINVTYYKHGIANGSGSVFIHKKYNKKYHSVVVVVVIKDFLFPLPMKFIDYF